MHGRTQMGGSEWDVDEKQIVGREVRVSVPSAGGELTKQLGSVVARGCPHLLGSSDEDRVVTLVTSL